VEAIEVVARLLLSEDRWLRLSAYGAAQALVDSLEAEPAARLRKLAESARSVETDALLRRMR
jgi:hypothetical protein